MMQAFERLKQGILCSRKKLMVFRYLDTGSIEQHSFLNCNFVIGSDRARSGSNECLIE